MTPSTHAPITKSVWPSSWLPMTLPNSLIPNTVMEGMPRDVVAPTPVAAIEKWKKKTAVVASMPAIQVPIVARDRRRSHRSISTAGQINIPWRVEKLPTTAVATAAASHSHVSSLRSTRKRVAPKASRPRHHERLTP